MAEVIRNKKAYDSGDVKVFINGIILNVLKIAYDVAQEHQLNYTLGNDPSSWSKGKKTPTCSMDLMMADVVPLEMAAPNGDLLELKPFDITVTFTNEYNTVVVDQIVAKFQNWGRDVTGEMGLQKSYDLFALNIQPNVAL